MRDKNLRMSSEWKTSIVPENHASEVKSLQEEIQRLKMIISKLTESMTWGNSVVKVLFRDEFFEEKYRLKFENFLREVLDDNEHFILSSQIYDITEQEFSKIQPFIQLDSPSTTSPCVKKTPNAVPIYLSEFEDVFHSDEPEEQVDKDKPQTMTCFNCLGDHHMNKCPKKIDRLKVAANKKDILVETSSRYHEEERKNAIKPGIVSGDLQQALGLRKDQLPLYIYKMRVIGYPPGWMDEALFETSGLSMYDVDGKADEESLEILAHSKKYDVSKFIEYPGFNCPVPSGCKDEWKDFGLVALQPHQQLSETLKSSSTINSNDTSKRKSEGQLNDSKKIRNGTNPPNNWSPDCSSTPKKQECLSANHGSLFESSISLSKSPGTPILHQGNCFQKLPDADKFAQGITEHLPFENLPDSMGKFDKMRGVLTDVQKKLKHIKNKS